MGARVLLMLKLAFVSAIPSPPSGEALGAMFHALEPHRLIRGHDWGNEREQEKQG
jgi:hypothetical protein